MKSIKIEGKKGKIKDEINPFFSFLQMVNNTGCPSSILRTPNQSGDSGVVGIEVWYPVWYQTQTWEHSIRVEEQLFVL